MKQGALIFDEQTDRYDIRFDLADGFSLAFESAAPSFHLFDLAVGVAGAVALRLMVYCKSKNAKKYRRGVEYGSARWGRPQRYSPVHRPGV